MTIHGWTLETSACRCCKPPGFVLHGGRSGWFKPPDGDWTRLGVTMAVAVALCEEMAGCESARHDLIDDLLGIPW